MSTLNKKANGGRLAGPQAGAWEPFDDDYFLTIEGKPLSGDTKPKGEFALQKALDWLAANPGVKPPYVPASAVNKYARMIYNDQQSRQKQRDEADSRAHLPEAQ
jgi:hypothetical protein